METVPAAVLFVDISGSTAYFDRYGEVAGRAMLDRCFEVLLPKLEAHDGRIVKMLGDGVLAVFPDARRAVEAACAAHTAVAETEEGEGPGTFRMRIHSGAHVGTVVVDSGGDVFGDVVNVAARIQHVAGPDQIFASADVVRELPPELRERTRRIGSFPLRGKGEEVELHEVLWRVEGATVLVSRAMLREEARLWLFYAGRVVEFPEDRSRLTLGRIPGNDIVVEDGSVSREHAEIQRRRGVFVLVDRSTNGTHLRPEGGRPRHLHREEAPLEGSGEFALGRPDGPTIRWRVRAFSTGSS
jgi:adenylate cyclase